MSAAPRRFLGAGALAHVVSGSRRAALDPAATLAERALRDRRASYVSTNHRIRVRVIRSDGTNRPNDDGRVTVPGAWDTAAALYPTPREPTARARSQPRSLSVAVTQRQAALVGATLCSAAGCSCRSCWPSGASRPSESRPLTCASTRSLIAAHAKRTLAGGGGQMMPASAATLAAGPAGVPFGGQGSSLSECG